MNHSGDESGPSTLVSGTKSTASISVKELMEPHVVLPMLVEIETVITVVDTSSSIVSSSEKMLKAMLDLLRDLAQVHIVTTSSGTLDLELGSVEEEETLQRLDQQEVDTEPDRSSPVAVATKEASVRVTRDIPNTEILTIDFHGEWILLVIFGQ